MSTSQLTIRDDKEESTNNNSVVSITMKLIEFPSFLIKPVVKNKSHQRSLKGEIVLKLLLDMAKVAGFDNTFYKYKMKGKWLGGVFETAFEADGILNR